MNPENIPIEALTKKHPERVMWEGRWQDYRLAYRGGFEFLAAAGQNAIASHANAGGTIAQIAAQSTGRVSRRFLWQLDGEPHEKYQSRWQRASYTNYMAAVIDYFRHWLYSQPPQIRPVEQKDNPEWWAPFYENANGGGMSLIDMGRESFLDALLYRRSGWLIGKGDEVAGTDGGVILTPYSGLEINDWQCSPTGELEWVTLCKEQTLRAFPDDRVRVRLITYVDRLAWHAWELRSDAEGNDKATYLGGQEHGLDAVPFVMREIPHGLWVADKLFAPCMSLFNRTAMLEYGEHMGCYLQAYMRTHEGRNAESRVLGDGILLNLRAAQEGRSQEEFGWIAPDISAFSHLAERLRQDRDEIYRVAHQMAAAVDSQAQTAVARSGVSKAEDRRSTEIILAGYGRYELRALVQTANLISKVHGDGIEWVGDGFENFQTSTLDEELQIAALAQAFNVKSQTFNVELQKMIATGRVLPHLDEATKQKIETEIEAAGAEPPAEVVPPPGEVDENGQPVEHEDKMPPRNPDETEDDPEPEA